MNYSKLKPIGSNVLLQVLKEDKTSSGLYLPEERTTSQWNPVLCVVLAAGSDKNIEVKSGWRVIVNKLSGQALEQSGILYKIVSYKDILCVVG